VVGREGGALVNGISALVRRNRKVRILFHVRIQQGDIISKTTRTLKGNRVDFYLDLGCSTPEL
jgi:hypothetical protein